MRFFLKFLSVIFFLEACLAGYPDFLCPSRPPAPGQNSTVFFSCAKDCIDQHGAVGGTCGDVSKGDFNCYCGELSGKRYEPSLHCMQPREDRYREMCTADCLCNHGATGGYCNWELKACVCMGRNPRNIKCPAKTVQDFAWIVYDKSGRKDLGPRGLGFVGKVIPVNN